MRELTEAELERVNKILLDASIELRNRLAEETKLPVGVMITGMFPKNERHGFAGFPSVDAAREAVRRVVRQWAKRAH